MKRKYVFFLFDDVIHRIGVHWMKRGWVGRAEIKVQMDLGKPMMKDWLCRSVMVYYCWAGVRK